MLGLCFCFSSEEKEDNLNDIVEPTTTTTITQSSVSATIAPTATPDVDEDGYSIQPKEPQWETLTNKKGNDERVTKYSSIM